MPLEVTDPQWFSTSMTSDLSILPGSIWQRLEPLLIVRTVSVLLAPRGERPGMLLRPCNAQDSVPRPPSPTNKNHLAQVIVPSWRNHGVVFERKHMTISIIKTPIINNNKYFIAETGESGEKHAFCPQGEGRGEWARKREGL